MVKKLFFGYPIAILFECFFELLLSSILVFKVPDDSYENKTSSKLIGVSIIVACLVLLYLMVWILRKFMYQLKPTEFKSKWGAVYDNL
jgi:uncharacterized membrane protein YdbT with pleckstrin-like domain